MKLGGFSTVFQKILKYKISYIRPEGAELFHAAKGKDMSKPMDAFRNSTKAPDNSNNTKLQTHESRQ